jgi:Leucine-rich repeat (LRR) protein
MHCFSNLKSLDDEDLKLLFKDIKSPRELILSNNRLTVESISTLLEMKNQSLKSLSLSYNPLGPSILLELPMLFKTFKKLEVLEMEGADLGHPLELGSTLHYDDVSEETDQINGIFFLLLFIYKSLVNRECFI